MGVTHPSRLLSDLPIVGPRLQLILIPDEVLSALPMLDQHRPTDWPGIGSISAELAHGLPLVLRRRTLDASPSVRPWLVRAMVVDDPDGPTGHRVVGHCGGHGRPDPIGIVEAGYQVATGERGNGFATEAMRAWGGWADLRGARLLRLSIEADNPSSETVARRLGFHPLPHPGDAPNRTWLSTLPLRPSR